MNDNFKIWNKVKQPPASALKTIPGGRLSGMTDIKPQWRIQIMTEVFGACGTGWKYVIKNLWSSPGSEEQVFAFADIDLYYKIESEWSEAIPGHGGSMLVTKESKGLHSSDEGFKMAITDALSTAMKTLGVASDIYMGNWNGSKYINQPEKPKPTITIGKENHKWLNGACGKLDITTTKQKKNLMEHYNFDVTKTTPEAFEKIKQEIIKDHKEVEE